MTPIFFRSGNDPIELSRHRQTTGLIGYMICSYTCNKLSLNVLEINIMLFNNYKKASTRVKINNIEMVYVNTFLGVLIDLA